MMQPPVQYGRVPYATIGRSAYRLFAMAAERPGGTPAAEGPGGTSTAGIPRGLRILVVEDEAVPALDLEIQLQRMGHEVVAVADRASEAIAAAGLHGPDVVLMDIRLADGSDGVEAAVSIRGLHDIPSIFLTAHSDPGTKQRAAAARPAGFLVKPFLPADVAAALALIRPAGPGDGQA